MRSSECSISQHSAKSRGFSAGTPASSLREVDKIRSILEYACSVWHINLPQYLSDKIEHVQRRVFRIIYPEYSYNEGLRSAKCFPLKERRQILCLRIFRKIQEPSSQLHCLLPRADMHERSDKPCPCTCHIHVYVLQNFMVLSHPHKFKSTNFLRCRLYNVTSALQLALAAVCRPRAIYY